MDKCKKKFSFELLVTATRPTSHN